MARHTRPQFVLFGASLTEYAFQPGGWGASLADIYARKADILLRGYNGWNTRRALAVLDEFFPKDAPVQPHLVVVCFGANDAAYPLPSGRGQHVPIHEYKSNLQQICLHIKGLSSTTRVVVITPPPIYEDVRRAYARSRWGRLAGEYLDRTNEQAGMYSEVCVEVAKKLDCGTINLWELIQRSKNWETECLSDGMHLSPIGNQTLLEELLKVLRNANWVPSLYWENMTSDFSEPSIYDYVHPSQELCPKGIEENESQKNHDS